MYLKDLSLINFKNYEQVTLSFSERINCFTGPNGVGKTNLLDAIHYLSLCKSFYHPSDSMNIRHGQEFFLIQGTFIKDQAEEIIHCSFQRNGRKRFMRNKNEYERLADHIGFIPAVIISPYDSRLISEGSEERRKFLDAVISQYDKTYLHSLLRYYKLLEQRNKFLKQIAGTNIYDADLLASLDEQMIPAGEYIFQRRKEFTRELIPVFNSFYHHISTGSNENVNIEYLSSQHHSSLKVLMENAFARDRQVGYSTEGIHKDDLLFTLNGYPVRRMGSQGQQKTLLTALKFAEFDFITRIKSFKPILLLDDIFDKFDESRVAQIMRLVSEDHFGQIFITDTEESRIRKILKGISVPFILFSVNTNGSISIKEQNP